MIQSRPMALSLFQQLQPVPRCHDNSVMLTPLRDVADNNYGHKGSY